MVLLRRKGRFFPFGGVIWADTGAEQLVAAPPAQADRHDPTALFDALVAELAAEVERGRARAAGTCVDLRRDPELGLVIRAELEDATGDARVALLRYERRFPRRILVDPDPVERPGVARLFPR